MLKVYIPPAKFYDGEKNEFATFGGCQLSLEHSLVSISKWESKWKKPFLTDEKKSRAETIDYVRCMTLTQNVDSLCYRALPDNVIEEINAYIFDDMTATTFQNADPNKDKRHGAPKKQIITSEYLYYMMFSYGIPIECQKWHLNRLLTLIRIFAVKNNSEKMSAKDTKAYYRSLNAARRAKSKR